MNHLCIFYADLAYLTKSTCTGPNPHVQEEEGVAAATEAADEEDGGGNDDKDMESRHICVSRHLHDWTLGEQKRDNMIYNNTESTLITYHITYHIITYKFKIINGNDT